jgi:hypothetical protein
MLARLGDRRPGDPAGMNGKDTVTTLDELRAVIAPPSELVTEKEVTAFDEYCRDFIARSPFVLIASTDGNGSIDVSPKGDPPVLCRFSMTGPSQYRTVLAIIGRTRS